MIATGYTDLDICNISASRVGWRPINSIENPKDDKETAIAQLYPITVDMLLSRYEWKFANQFTELAKDADKAGINGYKNAFKLPSAIVSGPYSVFTAANLNAPISDYIHANGYIFSNENSCFIKFRARPDEAIWPPYFIDLVAVALAARLATTPQVNKADLASELRIEAFGPANMGGEGGLFRTAKNADAKTQGTKSFFRNGDPLTRQVY